MCIAHLYKRLSPTLARLLVLIRTLRDVGSGVYVAAHRTTTILSIGLIRAAVTNKVAPAVAAWP